eukprot:713319-Prymnesium_polylepis.2
MESTKILYFRVDSLDKRNLLVEKLAEDGFNAIDCTGGQAAFEDGDLKKIAEIILGFARTQEPPIDVVAVDFRMPDPGLGLFVSDSCIRQGLAEHTTTMPAAAISYSALPIDDPCIQMAHGRVIFPGVAGSELISLPVAEVVQ